MKSRFALVTLLFALAVGGPWAWFHVAAPKPEGGVRLEARPELPGYTFRPEVLTDEVLGLLATTNVFNGSFYHRTEGRRVTVFKADWLPTEGVGKTVVNHTPDVCWVSSGWRPVEAGQPDLQTFQISGREVPFECRVFEAPDRSREVIVWCTLVNGEAQTEPFRFRGDARSGGRWQAALNLSRLAIGRFMARVERRYPATGHKQFYRFSTRLDGDIRTTLQHLATFADVWMTASSLESPR